MNIYRSKNSSFRFILLLLACSLIIPAAPPASASQQLPSQLRTKFDPQFLRQVLQAPEDEEFRFLVTMQQQAGLDAIDRRLPAAERRVEVVERLQIASEISQAALAPALAQLEMQGHIEQTRPFWIFNGMAVQGDRTALFTLAARDDVALLRPDRWQQYISPDDLSNTLNSAPGIDWGITRIRANQVWSNLKIDGGGVVVAAMDSGVDWLHPALQDSYRGWQHGTAIHQGNWIDVTGGGALYPVDSTGHGTHVMGLMAGQDGLGAAPGAEWIAVRAFNSSGYALDSWLHAGFEWLLAPGGNPALAPDIVNNSWSSNQSANIEFRPDVQALVAANILPVFAAGNNGPGSGSIGSPASFPESLAVAAVDSYDEVAWFSGRGPSPFDQQKPDLAAPGVNLLSSLPGGAYGENSGTSMAAPLVAGTAALVLQAKPDLSWSQLIEVLTGTASPIGSVPNQDTGWGRIDAFSAVESVMNPGYLSGVVEGSGAGPLVGASVRAADYEGGAQSSTTTGANGKWSLALAPDLYRLEVDYFGYETASVEHLVVMTGTVTTRDVTLNPLPTGLLLGQVRASNTQLPLPAWLHIEGTPAETTATAAGLYSMTLPAGAYSLTAELWGYRVGRADIEVHAGGMVSQTFDLDPSPAIVLVDSGAWYYDSQLDYYKTALDDLNYLYDEWTIRSVPSFTPVITDLVPYDAVIWSSPSDSPGYIGAGDVISDYLRMGGNVLLSGQDVGFWDSGASGVLWSPYYSTMLKANLASDNSKSNTLTGPEGSLLEGLVLSLNGPDSARNQTYPDGVSINAPDNANPLLAYDTGELGGIGAGLCLPYRSFYLSFGLEGAGDRAGRAGVVGKALSWFTSPRQAAGIEVEPGRSRLISPAGSTLTHTVRLYNTGEAGAGDTYTLELSGNQWPSTILTPTVSLPPCGTAMASITVDIPAGLGRDQYDTTILTVRSAVSPTLVATATLVSKTPASILLVDDDRWYEEEAAYRDALDKVGLQYDYWDVRTKNYESPGDPPADTLNLYPYALWFTGYDWYGPITNREAALLSNYLDNGGRLFLSSQDALYYQDGAPFSRDYLGVVDYAEEVTPTLVYGAGGELGFLGAFPLAYPFRNFSDGVIPSRNSSVEIVDNRGWSSALATRGENWKTVFFSFPFEALPEASRPEMMQQITGWLGWLGQSEFTAGRRDIPPGQTVEFTATLRNDGPITVTAVFSNPLPVGLSVNSSPSGGDLAGREITWEGDLGPGEEHQVTYHGTVTQTLDNTAFIILKDHGLTLRRTAHILVDAPDLSSSWLSSIPPDVFTDVSPYYGLVLINQGSAVAIDAAATWRLPATLTVLTPTLAASSGSIDLAGHEAQWSGDLAPGQSVTLTVTLAGLPSPYPIWHSSTAIIEDSVSPPAVLLHLLLQQPWRFYFPIIFR